MSDASKQQQAFAVGDDVFLTGDGPTMKVEEVEGENCTCVWIDKKNIVHRADFKAQTLSKVDHGYR